MPNAKLKHYLHLHFLVFIAGFTAILGELISISSFSLVWFRMVIAGILMLLYIIITKKQLKIRPKVIIQLFVAGIIIAAHWVTFFESINQSNVSIALAMFSSGAFFASFLEPLFFKRQILWYEILFGFLVIAGVFLITQGELKYINGIILGLLSAVFSSLFGVINGKFILKHKASVISLYEFASGIIFLSLFIFLFNDGFDSSFFSLSQSDWFYIFILASICTAYAFIAAVEVMKYISPFTVILSYNLEPVYGITLALILFPEKEQMSSQFYYGAVLVICAVVLDAVVKNYKSRKIKAVK
ncbi:DMT family transporter [Winogradskyella immobilis]|uniref:EamA family transporter n=1 Tax=Winogradskyella immobilis TaxID=2816852 RepID=A0ABS8EP81_9FLAO|nr:DMT family transporter [Winogradskyella immobilis]MCC1485013.1 EamA family transporter [Winogradskyella immobilis]MCG0017105.1 DMT family transporter [Winogradskyella immobilis]